MTSPDLPDIPFGTVKTNTAAHLNTLDELLNGECDRYQIDEWATMHRRIIEGHGTRAGYMRKPKCCDLCIKANTVYWQWQNAKERRERRQRSRALFEQSVLEDEGEL